MQGSFLKKRGGISKRSVIIPIILILVLFFAAGLYMISITRQFYFQEKVKEASLLARGYAKSLGIVIDAEYQLDQQMRSTLNVAGVRLSKYAEPFTNDVLAEFAEDLDVDVIYLYNQDLLLIHSSDNTYIGWEPEEGHPIQNFHKSGMRNFVEGIREDTVSGILYKYGYYRFPDNRMVQVGLRAETISELYAQFDPQYLINELMKYGNHTQIVYMDNEGKIIASSSPDYNEIMINATKHALPVLFGEYRNIEWAGTPYLVFRMPVQVKEVLSGSLLLFYDMRMAENLLAGLVLVISITLGLFFLLFSYSILHTYRKNKHIVTIAYHDELTGLPNHRYFNEFISESHGAPLTCLMLNPRNFKAINILYGYTYGNEVLIHIADVLSALQHRQASLQAFRISDDRFIILMHTQSSEKQIDALIGSLRLLANQYQDVSSLEFSIGISTTDTAGHDPSLLIKQASIALHATTDEIFIQQYDNSMEESLIRKDTIEQELKRAIRGEEGILSLAFQPIVEARDSSIHGFEALARMKSQKLGMISPMEFITLAEQRGLMVPLGDKIIDLATDFLQTIQERFDGNVNVAINVSALQMIEENFTSKFQELAKRKQINLYQVELELTESLFSQDLNLIARRLKELRQLGIRISIDDFGTGFSSLSRLGSLEIDILKLDRLFVMALSEESERDLVSDIISMAHHLGKKVVAEGVETIEQKQWLENAQCDLLQGYLFNKPLSTSDAILHLEQEKTHHA
ncbi:bifunctional diguanylate cyclase/phosphodiesterase [Sphaerochaeta sp. S2]|uniref:putative bifunctional diguanylate cyclase/phosphodiesterase n=1 Tax=Sphaerochaeta sp. S2 TaxID=2798868 RepID=UPI0018E979B7|nr:bifunctional diguanylate cyclase/phosphodiesterase [Sphaerochaeta sp. S2]